MGLAKAIVWVIIMIATIGGIEGVLLAEADREKPRTANSPAVLRFGQGRWKYTPKGDLSGF